MALDHQSQALLDAMVAGGFRPLREMGVDGCRRMTDDQAAFGRGPSVETVEDRTVGGPEAVPVRIYRPTSSTALPVLVYFHGGGWVMGGLESHDATCRKLAVEAGCAVVSVDYRLAPEHPFPAAIDDAVAVTSWTVEHAAEIGCDGSRMAVAGDSAGGNLAAVVAQIGRDRALPLVFQLLVYPVIDRRLDRPSMIENGTGYLLERSDMAWFWSLYDADGAATTDPRASPLDASDLHGLPPALVITAEHDPLRDEGEEYGARLQAAGVPTTVTRYPGTFHGFFAMGGLLDAATAAMTAAADALRAAFDQGSGG